MTRIIIICGPTATGKTSLALDLCREIDGEIISADSRQVYRDMDIVTGKDLPPDSKLIRSKIKWRDRYLGYYRIRSIPLWLYSLVSPEEPFSVSFWREAADLVICDLHRRHKIPVVVGGTGLYLKSLTAQMQNLSTPPNYPLRQKLAGQTASELMQFLSRIDSSKAASLNLSDRHNPRRLVRAIELSLASPASTDVPPSDYTVLQIGLSADRPYLNRLIENRIALRVDQGAFAEADKLISKYGLEYPSMSAAGYKAFRDSSWLKRWTTLEQQYVKRQLTWFRKQPDIRWFDISAPAWKTEARNYILDWYNTNYVPKS